MKKKKVSDVEKELAILRWARMDAEIRNALQGIKLTELEMSDAHRKYLDLKLTKEMERRALLSKADAMKEEYAALVQEIATKHGIQDPTKMSIDPDTGTVRDLSST
jgi:hypothetical protein